MTTDGSKSTIAIYFDELHSETSSVRSPDFIFRGLENKDWGLESSAYLRHDVPPSHSDFIQYNVDLIDRAKDANYHHREKNELADIELLAELRHYGAATALIDFTRDFLVALWFASRPYKEGENQKDGKVIIVNIGDSDVFLKLTSDDRQKCLRDILEFKTRMNQATQPADTDTPTPESSDKRKKLWFWQPRFEINHRLSAQKGVFVFGEAKISSEDIKYWEVTIREENKEEIRRELKAHFGIYEDSLFNDLPGFANLNDKNHAVETETADDLSRHGVQLSQMGKSGQAIRYFNRAIELEPDDPSHHYFRGQANRNLKKYKDALKDFSKAIELEPGNPNHHYFRGLVNHDLEKYEDALKDFNKAIELEPGNSSHHYFRGLVNHDLEKYEDALKDFSKAIELEPDDPSHHFLRGLVNHKLGKNQDALKDFSKAIELKSDYSYNHHFRGIANRDLEKYEDALKDFSKAIELEPDDPNYHHFRGLVNRDLEKYEDALEDATKAVELEPDNPSHHHFRGLVNRDLEKYKDALEDATKAVELEPDNPTFHSLRDDVSRDLEKYENVQRDIDKAT